MLLQDLLAHRGIDLARTKLVRHNLTHNVVRENHARGYLELYQRIQTEGRFRGCDHVVGFLGTEGTSGRYLGCYAVAGMFRFAPSCCPTTTTPTTGRSTRPSAPGDTCCGRWKRPIFWPSWPTAL